MGVSPSFEELLHFSVGLIATTQLPSNDKAERSSGVLKSFNGPYTNMKFADKEQLWCKSSVCRNF